MQGRLAPHQEARKLRQVVQGHG